MNALRVVAVDDETLALDRLSRLLDDQPDVELVGRAIGRASALTAVAELDPDLLILDIRMRDGTAFDLLEELPSGCRPMIAFVTAFPHYAYDAFGVEAVDYLLKPVEPVRLHEMLRKARKRRDAMYSQKRIDELGEIIRQLQIDRSEMTLQTLYDPDIWVRRRGTEFVRIPVESIDWIGAKDDYACIHALGREHLLKISLDRLLKGLDPQHFARIHRSYIVPKNRVAKISLKKPGVREVVLRDGTRLPLGRIHARRLDWRA